MSLQIKLRIPSRQKCSNTKLAESKNRTKAIFITNAPTHAKGRLRKMQGIEKKGISNRPMFDLKPPSERLIYPSIKIL